MYVSFNASESVRISITNEETPIKHYLRQPKRLVNAIADPQLMKQVSDDLYELKMRPINFMEIYHFQPIVLLKVWSGSNGSVYLQSVSCQIEGINYINKRFSLKLKGVLYPRESNGKTTLEGQSDLEVGVELPAALMFTPKIFLERAGNKLLKSVLSRIKNKLTTQLIQDYRTWASQETELQSLSRANLSPDLRY
ncbi:DUF1997 domain-containing protein [Waterburya agarophytonicola K14]|uniref:DUF1997 domain-containing protein n=1 Tax=Waterburya agarophytonicola KI4 TaxID=2874699 RepID=A0A964BPT7_9CYAN|nr:DUF1997 domain-containing protein [Waterburya agarophytonicola]MCC0175700.1 DUF1997 domain-containing protein [Waterburya agarophytonicola KI4]